MYIYRTARANKTFDEDLDTGLAIARAFPDKRRANRLAARDTSIRCRPAGWPAWALPDYVIVIESRLVLKHDWSPPPVRPAKFNRATDAIQLNQVDRVIKANGNAKRRTRVTPFKCIIGACSTSPSVSAYQQVGGRTPLGLSGDTHTSERKTKKPIVLSTSGVQSSRKPKGSIMLAASASLAALPLAASTLIDSLGRSPPIPTV